MSDNLYLKDIKELILKSNKLGITEVNNIEFLKGVNFTEEKYTSVIELIKQKKIEEIKKLPDIKPKTFEDLTIVHFLNQKNQANIAVIYDSDELWQDPEILDIFPQ